MELSGLSADTAPDEETADGPVLDHGTSPVAAMFARDRERGCVSRDEVNRAPVPGEAGADRVDDAMAMPSEHGIAVPQGGETDGDAGAGRPEGPTPAIAAAIGGATPPSDTCHPSTTNGASYPPLAQIHNRPRNRGKSSPSVPLLVCQSG